MLIHHGTLFCRGLSSQHALRYQPMEQVTSVHDRKIPVYTGTTAFFLPCTITNSEALVVKEKVCAKHNERRCRCNEKLRQRDKQGETERETVCLF